VRERERFEAAEQKRRLIDEAGGICVICRAAPAIFLAHRIPKTKRNLKCYGRVVIHHHLNLVPVCSDSDCNDACLIDNRPREKARLLAQIKAKLAIDFGLPPYLQRYLQEEVEAFDAD